MLYAILKPIVKASLRLYFRRISKSGLRHIDNGRPTLILANHTASFMDAILVACFVRRRIHFFARGDVFGNKWADKILRSMGLLPVYRLSEGRDKLHLNDSSNDEALEILRQGGAVLIFCEGASDIAKRLKPLKKGPFRLAATAATTLAGVPLIVPLGINYIAPAKPGGDVFLVAAPPFGVEEYIEGTSEPALAKAATSLMRETATALKPLVWHTEQPGDEPLADGLLTTLQESSEDFSFNDTRHLMHWLNSASESEKERLKYYMQPDQGISEYRISRGRYLLLLLPIPFVIMGWLFHLLPIKLATHITAKKVTSPDFYAPIFLSCAILITVAWYLLWLLLLQALWPSYSWLIILLFVSILGRIYLKAYWPLFRQRISSESAIDKVRTLLIKWS